MRPSSNVYSRLAIVSTVFIVIATHSLLYAENIDSEEITIKKNQFSGPLEVTFQEDGRLVKLNKSLTFFDSNGKEWTAIAGITSDGASIPDFVWPVIGPPFRGPYVRAAIVHDQYCYSRTEPSDAVHEMFRNAMVVDKVPSWKVTFMYGAVLWKGPKWDSITVQNARRIFKQFYYDGEKGFRECREKGEMGCYQYIAPHNLPDIKNYATLQVPYAICKRSSCTWSELTKFEADWIFKNSGQGVSTATEEEIKALLAQSQRAPGDYEAMQEFVARQAVK